MEGEYVIDLAEVLHSLETSDVIAMYFDRLRKTLLLDARTNALDGPLVKIVPMASSPEERFKSLKKMRPRFPNPESITIIPWPKYVASLERLGVLEQLTRRFAEEGQFEVVRQCQKCYKELLKLEEELMAQALSGENFETLWQRGGEGPA